VIIGRSTFVGSGRVAGHWGGDNNSKWTDMFFAIPQALTMSIFGIPLFGPDTCGFAGNSDMELCSRWMQLSAFFPFYRNHNVLAANPQEPYVWSAVTEATKTAMKIRYSLLPYMYTLFYHAHTSGSTVLRALVWEFPTETGLRAADRQFLLGPAILVTPVLNPGAETVDGVFPGIALGTTWYDWYTGAAVNAKAYENTTISAPLGHIPVFVRGGYVLPLQEPGYTTTESRGKPWTLLVALDGSGNAGGDLYIDDGSSLVPDSSLTVTFGVSGQSLTVTTEGGYVDTNPLANVTILGVKAQPSKVTVTVDEAQDLFLDKGFTYDSTSAVLIIYGLQTATSKGAWAKGWSLSWS
jgi:alpha-glucosidase